MIDDSESQIPQIETLDDFTINQSLDMIRIIIKAIVKVQRADILQQLVQDVSQ